MDETIESIGNRLKARGYHLRSGPNKDLYYIIDPRSGTNYSFRKADGIGEQSPDGQQWICWQITMNYGAASAAQVLAIALGGEPQAMQENPDGFQVSPNQPKEETTDV